MSNLLRVGASFLAISAFVLAGCSKEEALPVVSRTQNTQNTKTIVPSEQELKKAWETFVSNVENGKWKDNFGQYVDKKTQVADDGGIRPIRKEVDLSLRKTKKIVKKGENGEIITYLIPYDGDCPPDAIDCGGNGGGGGYTYVSSFISSENIGRFDNLQQNPYDHITDLEFAKSSYASVSSQPGYYKLDADLNKGAGGKYIYMCFTRGNADAHGFSGYPWSRTGPVTMLAASATSTSIHSRPYGYANIMNPTGTPVVNEYKVIDLNDGAGGKYIHGYYSKTSSPSDLSPRQNAPTPRLAVVEEVGIVSGNYSGVRPPDGWFYDPTNLNEGAGGDYIYLCWKYTH